MPRVILGCAAGVYIVFGLAFILQPRGLASLVGIGLTTPGSVVDFGAVYGGLELGLGLFLLTCFLRRPWLAPGLALTAMSFGGAFLARLYGFVQHPTAFLEPMMLALGGVEVMGVAAAWLALRSLTQRAR